MPLDRRPRFVTSLDEAHPVSRYNSVLTRGEKVIAVSHAARRYILEQYPQVEPDRVEVIHRGVDPAVFPHGYRPADSWYQRWFNQHPFLLERFVVTLPGALTPHRDHKAFIRLVEGLLAAGLPAHGLLVGADDPRYGKYAAKLRREIARRGLAERISFTGPRMDSRDITAASNLVLSLPVKPEFFDRAVLESLSMGVPVLGYDQGGVGELLAELFPQGRVPPGDGAALLAAALAIHQQCPEVAPARNHDLRGMLDRTLALYRGLSG
jgi:glycosyltransferase involved in cell wall biosynthesis